MKSPRSLYDRHRFLISNILKGFLGFGILILALHLIRFNFTESERFAWMQPLYERPNLVMVLFFASELLFGIIPPELFMLWAMQTQYLGTYAWGVVLMSVCSYCIGAFNYFLGRFLRDRTDWLHGKSKLVRKYRLMFEKYGSELVIVAATSPIPFSLVSLLGGAGGLGRREYLLNSLYRFPRYFLYAYALWRIEG
ncbi:VTT domain-containing protein [Mariniradius sediminis]|uniref:VTT domain-containing protein n=1 Tax=Mariniradius sediminis TaxID=2909237 RepID=A0ABS9BQR2_9BACT|nr:VTT domain-containing protein [Mariniradius sediminis]MCF1749832.1 VTT domain-containing protein [Mariniradius sediminis]